MTRSRDGDKHFRRGFLVLLLLLWSLAISFLRRFAISCAACKNPDGPCRMKTRDCNFFMSKVPDLESFVVPCYIREKINSFLYGGNVIYVQAAHDGGGYMFHLMQTELKTNISGVEWELFVSEFNVQSGDLLFEFGENSELPVVLHSYSIGPDGKTCVMKCKPRVLGEPQFGFQQIENHDNSNISGDEDFYDKVQRMHSVVVITTKLSLTEQHKENCELIVEQRGIRIGPLFLHKLTNTNTSGRKLKIPKKIAIDLELPADGIVVLCGSKNEEIRGEFSTSPDGRILVNSSTWNSFVRQENLQVGQVVMFLFHPLNEGAGVRISVDSI